MDKSGKKIRMLYLVGGEGCAERVDVSVLFAKRLANMGFEVDYVIYSLHPSSAWQNTKWGGTRAWVVGRSSKGGLAGALINKLYELLADLRVFWIALAGKYEVIQIRDKFVVALLGLIAARISGKKFFYWLSYPFAECRILDAKEGRARIPLVSLIGGKLAARLLYRVIMPLSDHVFVQSDQMLKDVAAEGISENLMTPVPMAVSEELLVKEGAKVVPHTILYLGTLARVRRLNVLIEALKIVREKYSQARLIYVGNGIIPEDRHFLEHCAGKLGLSEAVEFTGMVPMEEAHQRVMQSAVCVSPFYPTPILQSTSPTKLIEYMALGRPVVANTHPEQNEIMVKNGAGISVGWSAQEFARGIIALFDDQQRAEQMGQRGRDYVRENRTYPIIAEKLSAKYRELMNE